ncbi:MAG: rod shape-determining protein MreC [Alphaproteobacteria bacterium]|nr:rod shape-determining protein MreC [Alphaproteobacteria bacterium]
MDNRQFRLKRLKNQVYLFLPLVLLLISFGFILWGQFQTPVLIQLKVALTDTVSPIVSIVSAPVRWGKRAFWTANDFVHTYRDNDRLKAENETLKNWRRIALQLQSEQSELKRLLRYTPPPKATFLTAKTLTDNGSRFSKSLVVAAGRTQGVNKGDVAMTSDGVLGRIVEVGSRASRLMLLTDYASRVPVVVGTEQVSGILSGDGSRWPKLTSLPEGKNVRPGDVVLSSGQVGVYPAGLSIGIVETVDKGEIKVRLFEENTTPNFVHLVNFGIGSVLITDDCPVQE